MVRLCVMMVRKFVIVGETEVYTRKLLKLR